MKDIVVVGGGLAGLLSAILLNRSGFSVLVIERKHYPFHRVCGEYISNEVVPFLTALDIDLHDLDVARISRLEVTSAAGVKLSKELDMGGFGISRFTFDNYLYHKACAEGVNFLLDTKVENISFVNNRFEVDIPGQTLITPLVIGAFGKRSNLDRKLGRDFFLKKSPYFAVKVHLKGDFPTDLIQLHSYKNGYCGLSKIEGEKYCMCYLANSDDLRKCGNLDAFKKNILYSNKNLKRVFDAAQFLSDQPEVINEISFESKLLIENHVLMCGDSAGMIAPLCGNGMSMAIHAAYLLSDVINKNYQGSFSVQQRREMENLYASAWNRNFAKRIWLGRQLQHIFGSPSLMSAGLRLLNELPSLSGYLLSKTHGRVFELNY